jgi:RimJ/RimL family protein N-acetyltransferase
VSAMNREERGACPGGVALRDVEPEDLPIFFELQRDPVSTRMSAVPARDQTAFTDHWARILNDPSIVKKTIVLDGRAVGYLVCFERMCRTEVGYWIDRAHWGRGIATSALEQFLRVVTTRPLYGRVVKDNAASLRVLEKCGFEISGEEREFLSERGEEVEGFVLTLASPPAEDSPGGDWGTRGDRATISDSTRAGESARRSGANGEEPT